MTCLLASVTGPEEARIALAEGADIIDLKNPAAGALGGLPLDRVRAVVEITGGVRPVSATVGDLAMIPGVVAPAVANMAGTGVDFVKLGFFGPEGHETCIGALTGLDLRARLVAVLFADQRPDLALLPRLAAAGFAGVLLDTADKQAGSLRHHIDDAGLRDFIGLARACGLFCGLAGALRLADIPGLLALRPDILGFRGALCAGATRTATLDPDRLRAIRRTIPTRVASAV